MGLERFLISHCDGKDLYIGYTSQQIIIKIKEMMLHFKVERYTNTINGDYIKIVKINIEGQ